MATANPFRFSTKFQDDETGLLCYGYRYFDPGTGRWNSKDPIEEDGGANLYAFLWGDSLNYVDALGLKKCGVESFSVKWSAGVPGPKGRLLRIEVKIRFKKGGDYDPRCCEYKQNAGVKSKWKHKGQSKSEDISMSDDGYSRDDDINDNTDRSGTSFETNDNPGIKSGSIDEGDVIDFFTFTAEQIVYSPGRSFPGDPKKKVLPCDCEKNDSVAKKGPHTATVKGTYSTKLRYDKGVPADL